MLRRYQRPLAIFMALLQYFYAITAHGIPAPTPRAMPPATQNSQAQATDLLEEAAATLDIEEASLRNIKKRDINHLAEDLLKKAESQNKRYSDYKTDFELQTQFQPYYHPTNTAVLPDVDNNGRLSFSYPLDLPVLGLVPTVGISYSGIHPHGDMGQGFRLNSHSTIRSCKLDPRRSPKLKAPETTLCLDGRKLIRFKEDDKYIEYRTQIASQTRVLVKKHSSHIQVIDRAGREYIYKEAFNLHGGRELDIWYPNSHLWHVTQVKDMLGNYAEFIYDDVHGKAPEYVFPDQQEYVPWEQKLIKIRYGGNLVSGAVHRYEIAFDYSFNTKTSRVITYPVVHRVGGAYIKKISVHAIGSDIDTQLIRYYDFDYRNFFPGMDSQPNLLQSITSCSRLHCEKPMVFEWSLDADKTITPPYQQDPELLTDICSEQTANRYPVCNDADNTSTLRFVDLDNNGYADLCYRGDHGVKCHVNIGRRDKYSFQTTLCANGSPDCNDGDNHYSLQFADFDNDQIPELTVRRDLGGISFYKRNRYDFDSVTAYFYDKSGSRLKHPLCANQDAQLGVCNDGDNHGTFQPVDIDGNGWLDFCYRSDRGIRCFQNITQADDTDLSFQLLIEESLCANGDPNCSGWKDGFGQFVDVDQDGVVDFAWRSPKGYRFKPVDQLGAESYDVFPGICNSRDASCNDKDNFASLNIADQNGDGVKDICLRFDNDGVRCYLGFTRASNPIWSTSLPIPSRPSFMLADDKAHEQIEDILPTSILNGIHKEAGHKYSIATKLCPNGSSCELGEGEMDIKLLDLNTDGRADLIYRLNTGAYNYRLATGVGFSSSRHEMISKDSRCGVPKDGFYMTDINGDSYIDIVYLSKNGLCTIYGKANRPELIGIEEAHGARFEISYGPLTDPDIYDSSYKNSRQSILATRRVVKRVDKTWRDFQDRKRYKYSDLTVSNLSGDPQGFRKITRIDLDLNSHTITQYAYDAKQFINGVVELILQYQGTSGIDALQMAIIHKWQSQPLTGDKKLPKRVQLLKQSSGTIVWPTPGDDDAAVYQNQYYLYDSFNNTTQTLTTYDSNEESWSSITRTTYENDTDNWHIGRVLKVSTHKEVGRDVNANSPETQTVSFRYNADGQPVEKISGTGDKQIRYTYSYNDRGMVSKETTSWDKHPSLDFTKMTKTISYDDYNRPIRVQYDDYPAITRSFDPVYGYISEETAADGIRWSLTYDSFGRELSRESSSGIISQSLMLQCAAFFPCVSPSATYQVRTYSQGRYVKSQEFNGLGQEVGKSQLVGQDFVNVLIEYTNHGLEKRRSAPFYYGEKVQWSERDYDSDNRLTKLTYVDGSHSEIEYGSDGMQTHTNALGQSYSVKYFRKDKPLQVIDAAGGITNYQYDLDGRLIKTTAPDGTVNTAVFNSKGLKTSVTAPGQKTVSYTYNPLGKIYQRHRGDDPVITYKYNSRLQVTDEIHGDLKKPIKHVRKTYNARGQLLSLTDQTGYEESYSYSSRTNQLTQKTIVFEGVSYSLGYSYYDNAS